MPLWMKRVHQSHHLCFLSRLKNSEQIRHQSLWIHDENRLATGLRLQPHSNIASYFVSYIKATYDMRICLKAVDEKADGISSCRVLWVFRVAKVCMIRLEELQMTNIYAEERASIPYSLRCVTLIEIPMTTTCRRLRHDTLHKPGALAYAPFSYDFARNDGKWSLPLTLL